MMCTAQCLRQGSLIDRNMHVQTCNAAPQGYHHCMNVPCSEMSCLCRTTEQTILNAMGAVFIASTFLAIVQCILIQPIIAMERAVMYRERAAGMYNVMAWFFGLVGCLTDCLRSAELARSSMLHAWSGWDNTSSMCKHPVICLRISWCVPQRNASKQIAHSCAHASNRSTLLPSLSNGVCRYLWSCFTCCWKPSCSAVWSTLLLALKR